MTVGMSLFRGAAAASVSMGQSGARYKPPKSLEQSTISAVGISSGWSGGLPVYLRERGDFVYWPLALILQGDGSNSDSHVDAGVPLDTDGLQRDRLGRAAEQHIGISTDAGGRARRDAAVVPGQCASLQVGARSQHCPDNDTALLKADVHAEFRNLAGVVFGPSLAGEYATQVAGGSEDEAPSAGHVAGHHTDLHRGVRRARWR